jgi:hypothetical protein
VIDFVVRYPWGGLYCGELRSALRQLGVPTLDDPLTGGDADGFFISTDKRRLVAARRLLRDYNCYLESDGEDRFDDIMAALYEGEVYEVMQDWNTLIGSLTWRHWRSSACDWSCWRRDLPQSARR